MEKDFVGKGSLRERMRAPASTTGKVRRNLRENRSHGWQFLLLIPPILCETCLTVKCHRPIRKYSAEQGIAEDEAIKRRMQENSKEFVEKGAEVYAKE